jgi:hypothetical protein
MSSKKIITVNYKISKKQIYSKLFILNNLQQSQPLGHVTRYMSKAKFFDRVNIS